MFTIKPSSFVRLACGLLLIATLAERPVLAAPPVNQPPTFTSILDNPTDQNTITVVEDSGLRVIPHFLTAITPVEAGQGISVITTTNNNNALFATQPIIVRPATELSTATLYFRPGANAFGTAIVTIAITDNGGTANGGQNRTTYSFTINVTPINDAPTLNAIANITTTEGSGLHTVTLMGISPGPTNEFQGLGDVEDGPHIYDQRVTSIVATSSNPDLVRCVPVHYEGGSTADLSFTPTTDGFGTATITVTLTDNGGTENGGHDTFTRAFKVTVNPINDAPRFKFGPRPPTLMYSTRQAQNGIVDLATGKFSVFGDLTWSTVSFQSAQTSDGKIWQLGLYNPPPGGGHEPVDGSPFHLANLDPVTGVVTPVGDSVEIPFAALASDPNGNLFAVGFDDNLYSIDKTTAAETLIGATELSGVVFGLTFDGAILRYVDSNNSIGTIDTSTGLATPTGELHVGEDSFPNNVLGLTVDAGTHYTVSPFDREMLTVTPAGELGEFLALDSFPISAGPIVHTTQVLVSVPEDSGPYTAPGFTVCTLAGPANESSQRLGFTVTTDNDALFLVKPKLTRSTTDPTLATLTFTPAKDAFGQALVTVILKDNGPTGNGNVNQSDPKTFLLRVSPVNDAPVMNRPANVTVFETPSRPESVPNELPSHGAHSVVLTGIKPGPANESFQTVVEIDAFAGLAQHPDSILENISVDYEPGATTATLYFDTRTDANGTDTINIELFDDGSGVGVATANFLPNEDSVGHYSFQVTVRPVNSPPTSDPLDRTCIIVAEDEPLQVFSQFVTGVFAGPRDEAGQAIGFLVSNDNPTLFANQPVITLDPIPVITGADSSLITGPRTGTLKFKSAPAAFGTATVTVRVHDNGGVQNGGFDTGAPMTFTIKVTPVNDPPTLNAIANVTIAEDTTKRIALIGISPGPANESDQTLCFRISSDNTDVLPDPSLEYTNGNQTAILNLVPVANAHGIAHVTVTITDNGRSGLWNHHDFQSVTRMFTVTVAAVNDPPTFAKGPDLIVDQNNDVVTIPHWATDISPGPQDEVDAGQTVAFLASRSSMFIVQPTVNAAGDLTFKPAANATGVATVSVQPKDSAGAYGTPQTFTITVLADIIVADRGALDSGAGKILRIRAVSGTQSIAKSGLLNPYGLNLAANRDVFITRFGDGSHGAAVLRHHVNTVSVLATNGFLVSPVDVVVEQNSALVVADAETPLPEISCSCDLPPALMGALIRINSTNGVQSRLASGFVNLAGVAITSHGALYVTDGGDGLSVQPSIIQVSPVDGSRNPISTGGSLVSPVGIVEDPNTGDLIVADPAAKALIRVNLSGEQSIIVQNGLFQHPNHVTVDATGDFIVTDDGAGEFPTPQVLRVKADGTQSVISTGGSLVSPQGVTINPKVVTIPET